MKAKIGDTILNGAVRVLNGPVGKGIEAVSNTIAEFEDGFRDVVVAACTADISPSNESRLGSNSRTSAYIGGAGTAIGAISAAAALGIYTALNIRGDIFY